MSKAQKAAQLKEHIIKGKRKEVPELVNHLLESGMKAYDIITEICAPSMSEVGVLYQEGEYFIPEILMSAKAFEAAMEVLQPFLKDMEKKATGIVVLGVCEGDIHTIGKNLVATMLEAAGFTIIDLGRDVPAKEFVKAAKESNADLIGVSALMTTSMMGMKKIVDLVKEEGIRVKVMVGGGPVTKEYAMKIGADGYGEDAKDAVDLAIHLMEE
ncbi:MAG: B12-binding domain-containing protein [Candidatus Thorarchaeota archaeon]